MKKYIGVLILILLLFASYSFPAVELDTDSDGYIDIGYMPLDQSWSFSAGLTATTSITPNTADGTVLGSTSLEFSDLYLADSSVIYFGNDQDVTLTHSPDTGLSVNLNLYAATYGSDGSISDAELKTIDDGATTEVLVGGGAGSAPVWTTATGSGAPVRATSPTLVTPALGTIASGDGNALTNLDGENIADDTIDDDSIDFNDVTLADLTDDVGYEEETHASEHNDGGADEIDRGTEGITIQIFTDEDATPDVSNGGSEIVRLWKTGNTASTTITDFDDGDDHSEFADGDWFVLRCLDSDTTIDFSANANIEGNAGTDFTCSATQLLDLVFRWDNGNSRWVCQNLNSGFSDPLTLAISKAQFDYNIANPQTVSNFDTDDTDYTVGTEITSSILLIDGVNDGDGDSIDLQDAGSAYDGMLLVIKALSDIDVNDPFTIDVSTDATACNDCPFGGVFVMYSAGAILKLRWDNTNTTWQFESFYQPPVDWGSESVTTGFTNDPTPETGDQVLVSVVNNLVTVLIRIIGESNDTDFTFTLPYTSSASYPNVSVSCLTEDNSNWGAVALTDETVYLSGRIVLGINSSTATVYPAADMVDGTWTGSNTKGANGQFIYRVD